jgi:hypothetical protein
VGISHQRQAGLGFLRDVYTKAMIMHRRKLYNRPIAPVET